MNRAAVVIALAFAACKTTESAGGTSKAIGQIPVPIEALYALCWPEDVPPEARVKVGFQGADVFFEATNGATNSTGRCVREIAASYPYTTKPTGNVELAPVKGKPTGWAALSWARLLSSSRYSDERGLTDPLPMAVGCAKLFGLRADATYELKHAPDFTAQQVGGPVTDAERCMEAVLGATAWPSTRELLIQFGAPPSGIDADPRAHIYEPDLRTESHGTLPAELIHEAMAGQKAGVSVCWESALLRRPNLSGARTIRFRVDAKSVVHAWIAMGDDTQRQVSDFKLDACLIDLVQHARFESAGEGVYTWVFAQR